MFSIEYLGLRLCTTCGNSSSGVSKRLFRKIAAARIERSAADSEPKSRTTWSTCPLPFFPLPYIDKINRLAISEFKGTNIIKGLTVIHITGNFKYSYRSIHKTTASETIELYHLMLDFSDVISS